MQRPQLEVLKALASDVILCGRQQCHQFLRILDQRLTMIRERKRYESAACHETADFAKRNAAHEFLIRSNHGIRDRLVPIRIVESFEPWPAVENAGPGMFLNKALPARVG